MFEGGCDPNKPLSEMESSLSLESRRSSRPHKQLHSQTWSDYGSDVPTPQAQVERNSSDFLFCSAHLGDETSDDLCRVRLFRRTDPVRSR